LSFDYLPIPFSLIGTSIACLLIFIISRKIIPKLHSRKVIRIALKSIMEGPVIVAVFSFGLLLSWRLSVGRITVPIPEVLRFSNLLLIVEIIILIVSIYAARRIIREAIPPKVKTPESGGMMIYSIYALGFLVFLYILLNSSISPNVTANVWSIIGFLTGITLTYLAVHLSNILFTHYSGAIESHARATIRFLRRLILAFVALVGVAVTTFANFPSLGAAVASLFVAAGFASIVVGLAAQGSISNIIAGFVISTSRPFKIGDALSYANEWAWVEDINLTFTILKTWDNRRLVVPNQMFLNSTVINYDGADSTKLCVVYVTITFESNLDKAIDILKEIANAHPDFLPADNLPVVHVMDLGDANATTPGANAAAGISLRLLSRAKDQSTNFQMSKDILYSVKKAFEKNGIELAYPRRQIVIDPSPRKTADKTSVK
jgi:small conductance mechanosensitive channel